MNASAAAPESNTASTMEKLTQGSFPRIVIVGAGISGLCLAIRLKKAGIHSFVILEKSNDVGGTWLDNTYPGCGCDIPSMLYSFSFAIKPDWSRKYAPQSEILDYFRECADRFAVREHICFGEEVTTARFDDEQCHWRIETVDGQTLEADIFVSAVGQLNRPKLPSIQGLETFEGDSFHTACWPGKFDPAGKDIAVIGNGASAIQLIPKLAESARSVSVYQRSANWIARRHDYRYPRVLKWAFRWLPFAARLHRAWIYFLSDMRILLYKRKSLRNKGFTAWLYLRMKGKLPQELRSRVIPKYPAGCKRVLLSNDYLEALRETNVQLIERPIQRVESEGIVSDDQVRKCDAIVLATGFQSTQFLVPMDVKGRDGVDLHEQWSKRPHTYYGMFCPNFPNLVLLYGPNTNLGHNSIIFMVECQVRYLIRLIQQMKQRDARSVEVREAAVKRFDEMLQNQLREKVWNGYISNWYKTDDGHIVNNWSGSTTGYWRQTRRPQFDDFIFSDSDAD